MYRVLLAEDETVMRIAFLKMMDKENSDYTLAAAVSNGAEALQYISQNPVDIVVTDLMMPIMDGLELIDKLKENGFSGVILVLSNYTDFDLVRTALTSGAADYMLKLKLDGESLRRQLDKAAAILKNAGLAKEKESDETAESVAVREYFLAEGESTAPHELLEMFKRHIALTPCAIFVKSDDGRKNLKGSPLESALTILEQMFAEMEAYILALNSKSAILLIPVNRQNDSDSQLDEKFNKALREISLYLNLEVSVLLAPNSHTPKQARQYYRECAKALDLHEFSLKSTVSYLEDVIFAHMPQFLDYKKYKKEVRAALIFIHFHFSEKISLDDVAKATNLNSSYLCRLFKQETGGSMFRYINDLRMQKAAALIEAGNTYIREVAFAVGIEDQFFFARIFKKYYGVPPSEYWKSKQKS